MEVVVKRPLPTPGSPAQQTLMQKSPRDNRFGEKGRVRERHSEDNTADVLLDSGTYLKRVPVTTSEWFIFGEDVEKDYNAGERDLPPIGARVFVFMPTANSYDDSFIAPFSFFSTPDQIKPYMDEDKETIKERIMPNKWHTKLDYATGTYQAVSPDEKSSILLDFGDKDNPLDPPELHTKLFHDEENDDPGIKLDVVSGDTIDLSVFKDIVLHHKKEEVITAEIFEETNFEYNKKEKYIKGSVFEGETDFAHKKGDSLVLHAFDTEIIIKKGLMEINHKGDYIENIEGNKVTKVGKNITVKATGSISESCSVYNRNAGTVNDNC